MKWRLLFLKATCRFSEMLYVDFAESYKNDKGDVYFGNQYLKIFKACSCAKSSNNNDVRNDNVIVVTKSSDHDRVTSMNCLQNVVHKMEHMHEKTYGNVHVSSDGMGSQFRSLLYI